MATQDTVVVAITSWEILKIYFLSCIIGSWVVLKRLVKRIWNPTEFSLKTRDTPPACLVDSSFGRHSYIKVQGAKLHYVECGCQQNPMLVLLHGFPDCWLTWQHQIPILSKHFRVIALDLKGFGDSDKPTKRNRYRIDTLLEELKDLILGLGGVTPCTLVGHDLGALLCWHFLHQHPEMVAKFICISCPHPNIYWSNLPRASLFNMSWISFSQLPYLPETEALSDGLKIMNQCFPHLQKKSGDDQYMVANKYAFSRKEDWTGAINYFRNLPFHRVNAGYEGSKVPCLLMTGNRDPAVPLESVVRSTEFTDKFTVKIVDGAGHYPHQEKPDVVNRILVNFLVAAEAPSTEKQRQQQWRGGLVGRMLGAVSSTVSYVHKTTSSGLPTLKTSSSYLGHSAS